MSRMIAPLLISLIPAKSSASSGPSKPWRQPLTICSMQNSTISAPAIGTLAV